MIRALADATLFRAIAVRTASGRSLSKERDNETGLDYFGTRYISSPQGRFTSADPYNIILQVQYKAEISPQDALAEFINYLGHPQQWDRYSYVANNPLKYIDPTGEKLELIGNDLTTGQKLDNHPPANKIEVLKVGH